MCCYASGFGYGYETGMDAYIDSSESTGYAVRYDAP